MSKEADLIEDLERIGIYISSVWDLLKRSDNYNEALTILIDHLKKAEDVRLKEGIVRAMGCKGFNAAVPLLIAEYKISDHDGYKWAIANTLEIIAPKEALAELNEIMADRKHGDSRQMIALALGKIKDKSSFDILIKVINDPGISGHVVEALGKIGDVRAIEPIKPFLNHEMRWIRKASETALKRIYKKNNLVSV
jgi:HEAT repeat protein